MASKTNESAPGATITGPSEIEDIERALESGVPEIYVNGFANGLSHADVVTAFMRNGRPAALINMSYTTAKTYSIMLAQLISQFEEKTDRSMLTSMDVDRLFEADAGEEESK